MEIAIVTDRLDDNQIGRTHSVYSVARAAGMKVRVVTLSRGEQVMWAPLRGSDFDASSLRLDVSEIKEVLASSDVVIAAKPRPSTLGLAHPICRELGVPLIVDIDDPDLEVVRSTLLGSRAALQPVATVRLVAEYRLMRRQLLDSGRITSNPVLHRRYGGLILPHARDDVGAGKAHTSEAPVVAFIGSPKPHKGIAMLRDAVADLANLGYSLIVTGMHPGGPNRPWENWVGPQGHEASMSLLRQSDIVALPTLNYGWGRGQLPMKLMDAMLAGRGITVSALEPASWALAECGIVFPSGSMSGLAAALLQLRDPSQRSQLGTAARKYALEHYTPEALAPKFAEFISASARRKMM